ncbi:hypothetical protein [Salibaculum griseiflavum]|uniref:Lipopolysaccharide export system protein LptC n=1 Tax=Salibaculum griseiflavum TaxID=1914409 RepID=A0A2V1P3I7_9RHOB|nr:hypothetical protein [Salibaculum griseiflavum]PWG16995.1 hypothetical protein DFK10_08060 [Salibaculum griseiflavum]
MARAESLRSRYVAILKIALPLAALALMSTVFLLARAPLPSGDIPYAEIEGIAREPRVSGAQVTGVATDGSVVEVIAGRARPDGALISIDDLRANIVSVEGVEIAIRAGDGEVDNDAQVARLFGLTRISTSNGYEMETTGLSASIASGRVESDGALEVRTPFGDLTAGKLVIETPNAEAGQRMLFQEGVRLVYDPKQGD